MRLTPRVVVAVGFEDGADFGIFGRDFEELFGVGDVGGYDLVLGAARLLGLGFGGCGDGFWGGIGHMGFLVELSEPCWKGWRVPSKKCGKVAQGSYIREIWFRNGERHP